MHAPPAVSIVIPAYNEESTIRACVIAALEQTVPAAEIIVVDNRSTDGTAAAVAELQRAHPDAPVIYFRQDAVQGLIPTRDFGLDRAQGDVLGRIDADSVIERDWVENVQRVFSDPGVDAATGPVRYYDMPLRRLGLKADDTARRGMMRLAGQYPFLFGSNMALRASAWEAIRAEVCADGDDLMHEDIDLSLHLREHGMTIRYDSRMVAGMSARRLDDSPRDYFHYVTRFERTYKAHRVHNVLVRMPMAVFFAIYPPLNAYRRGRALQAARR